MKKRLLALFMSLCLVVGLLPTAAWAEEGAVELKYDDRWSLGGKTVQSIDNHATSKQVGTDETDSSVLTVSGDNLIATGVGTATVTWDDNTSTDFVVSPAVISLIMITGHSLGAGQVGDTGNSIRCADGQAYSTHEADSTRLLSNVEDVSAYGIGSGAASRPSGIDAMTSGSGVAGNDSGVAYQWNQATGEKIWVLNAGHGGTNLDTWKAGASDYTHAVTLFQKAERILSNEIKAGHYTLGHMGILNHTTANGDQTWGMSEYTQAFNSMWNGFKSDLAYDVDGDGNTETVDCIGLLPIWNVCAMNKWNEMKAEPQAFYNDSNVVLNGKLVNYGMSVFGTDVVMASVAGRTWCQGNDAVQEYFDQNPLAYSQTHNGKTPTAPTTLQNGVYGDGVHYNQLGYNVTGMEAAESLLEYWNGQNSASSYQLLQKDGKTEVPDTLELNVGDDYIIVPEVTPSSAKLTYSIEDTDGVITYDNCVLHAEKNGTATLKIGNKTVAVTVTGTAPAPTGSNYYEWNFEDSLDTDKNVSSGANAITAVAGEPTLEDGALVADSSVMKLAQAVTLDPNKNWSVEVTQSANWDTQNSEERFTGPLLSTTETLSKVSIWVPNNGNMCFVQQRSDGQYQWYMVSDADWDANFPKNFKTTDTHTYRLMNTEGVISYWLDGKKIGDLTAYRTGGSTRNNEIKPLETPITYTAVQEQYIGVNNAGFNWKYSGKMDMLRIHEDGAIVTFDPALEAAGTAQKVHANLYEEITLPQLDQGVYNMTFTGWRLGNTVYQPGTKYQISSLDDISFTAEWEVLAGQYLVVAPVDQHVTIVPETGSSSPVDEGGSYSFTVSVEDGYGKTDDFAVFVNGTELTADENGVYTISDIREQKTISVTGVERIKTPEEIEHSSVVTLYKADGTQQQDSLSKVNGTYSIDQENAALTVSQGSMLLDTAAQFDLDKNWTIEFCYQAAEKASKPVFSDVGRIAGSTGNTSIWVTKTGELRLTYKTENKATTDSDGQFFWYGTADEPEICKTLDITQPHTYRMTNQNGTISYSIDGVACGALTSYSKGTGSRVDSKGNDVPMYQKTPDFNFKIGYIGAENKVTDADWWLYGTVSAVKLCEDTATVQYVDGENTTYEYFKLVGDAITLPETQTDCKAWLDASNKAYPSGQDFTIAQNGVTVLTASSAHDLAAVAAVDATCTEDGVKAHDHCAICGKDFVNGEKVTEESLKIAAGHKLTAHAAVEATCTTDGTKAYWSCDVCGKLFADENGQTEITEEDLTVKATGHQLTAHDAVAATCTENGTKAYWSCDVCHKLFADENGQTETTQEELVVLATGHQLTPHDAVAATCTTDGNEAYWECGVCHKLFTDENGQTETTRDELTVSATGHQLTAHDAVAATCTTDGSEAYWECDVCHKLFADENGQTETTLEELKIAASHQLTPHDAVAATCTENGTKAYWSCDVCGKLFADENGQTEITEEDLTVKATGHQLTAHDAVAATCTENGTKAYWSCNVCGKLFADENGKTETTLDDLTVPATGHDWSNKDGVCKTCQTACDQTHTPGTTCEVCGKVTASTSSGGHGGGSRNNSYAVSTPKADNGSVTVNNGSTAKKGDTVTITVKPNEGYKIGTVTVTDSKGNSIALTDKGDGKYSFTMPDSKVDVKATFVKSEVEPDQSSKTTFVDVPEGIWYEDAANFVAQRGLMSGVGENLFGGSQNTTRAMLMTILARMDGQDVTGGSTWYEKAMTWAKANGVSDGTMPTVNITREQLATMLYSYAKLKGLDPIPNAMALSKFSDSETISTWASDAVSWAASSGIISGRSNGTVDPQAGATRAEMAVMLQQFVKLMEK